MVSCLVVKTIVVRKSPACKGVPVRVRLGAPLTTFGSMVERLNTPVLKTGAGETW